MKRRPVEMRTILPYLIKVFKECLRNNLGLLSKMGSVEADNYFDKYQAPTHFNTSRRKPLARKKITTRDILENSATLVVLLTKLDLNSRCVFCKPLPHLVVRPRPLHGAGITMIVFWP